MPDVDGPGLLAVAVAHLSARHELEWIDQAGGRFRVLRDGEPVTVELPPALVEEYVAQLGDDASAGPRSVPPEQPVRLRAQALGRLVDELVDADVFGSLRRLLIERQDDGGLWLKDVRGPETRPRPGADGGASWTAERPVG